MCAFPQLDLDAHQSDSDDLLQRLCAWRHRQTNAAESDSVNENFLPSSRPQRRKRKFKRMAVDLQPPTDDANVQVTKVGCLSFIYALELNFASSVCWNMFTPELDSGLLALLCHGCDRSDGK